MAGPFLGDRPFLTIGDKTYSSPVIWEWFQTVKRTGGTLMITDQDPLYTYMQNGVQIIPPIWARQFDPSEIITGNQHVWIWAMMPGQVFSEHAANLSVMASEHLIIPIYATSTDKLSGIEINGQAISLFCPWSGDGGFWRSFGLATLATVAVAVTAGSLLPGIPSTVTGSAAIAAAAPTPWEIATAGMAEGMGTGGTIAAAAAAATPWEIATAGMAEGMGTGGTIAAAGGSSWASLASTGASIVKGAESVAGAVVATRTAIDTIQAAASTPPAPPAQPPSENTQPTNAMIYAGALLVFLALT